MLLYKPKQTARQKVAVLQVNIRSDSGKTVYVTKL